MGLYHSQLVNLILAYHPKPKAGVLLRALFFHKIQPSPGSPPGYRPKACPKAPHILICSSAGCANSSPALLEGARMEFHVAILLQQLSPSGSGGRCPQPPRSGPGNMCRVTLGRGGVQGGTHPSRVASHYVLPRSRNLHPWSHFGPKAPPANPGLVWQVPAQLHQLPPYTLTSARWCLPPHCPRPHGGVLTHGGLPHQPSWRALHYKLQGCLSAASSQTSQPNPPTPLSCLPLLPQPTLILKDLSWNFLHDLMSGPSYNVLLFQFP